MRTLLLGLMALNIVFTNKHQQVTAWGQQDLFGVNYEMNSPPLTLGQLSPVIIALSSIKEKINTTALLLCRAEQFGQSVTYFKVLELKEFCLAKDATDCTKDRNSPANPKTVITYPGGASYPVFIDFANGEGDAAGGTSGTTIPLDNYFYCLTFDGQLNNCSQNYSPMFNIVKQGTTSVAGATIPKPSTQIVLLQQTQTYFVNNPTVTLNSAPTASASGLDGGKDGGFVVITSNGATITGPRATVTPPATSSTAASGVPAAAKSSSGGLSVGAKAGIAVGALGVLFLILLAALFFLRRAHRKKRAHNSEQVMLNRSIANDSRDLMAEKEAGHTSPSSFDAPVPVFAGGVGTGERPGSGGRHSALSPYEQIPSQPYSGSAAAVPRRKATTSALSNAQSRGLDSIPASEPLATGGLVSRGVSNASTNIVSPRSPVAPSSSDPSDRSHEFEEYHDVPVYGDARHVPQVFNGGLQAPFLAEGSENSLSSAEAARLAEEEEERRIDAAIAEAERTKGGGR